MDITQALKDTENSLRDFISRVLYNHFGNEWINNCGISQERISIWKKRKLEEEKKQKFGTLEERLIYYADFYDIRTILEKNWTKINDFPSAFGKWKFMELWLIQMEDLRNPDAHRRELLPHQKHLLLGIAGEIRTRLIRYRSKMETTEDYFPRIECVRDNVGNISLANQGIWRTKTVLRPGDFIEFVVTAADPMEANLQYALTITGNHYNPSWQNSNALNLTINSSNVRNDFGVMIWLKSLRDYHAKGDFDDSVTFIYTVLPST